MNLSRWTILVIDLLIVLISLTFAYLLRYNFHIPSVEYDFFVYAFPFIFLIRLATFLYFKTYAGVIFHTGFEDVKRIFVTMTIGSFIALMIIVFTRLTMGYNIIPWSILIIDYILGTFLIIVFRAGVKLVYQEVRNFKKHKQNVAVIGIGNQAVNAKKTLEQQSANRYAVSGFFDPKNESVNRQLLGVNIFALDHFERMLFTAEIDMAVLAADLSLDEKERIALLCAQNNIKLLQVPVIENWDDKPLRLTDIKKINVEDLLEREPIKIDNDQLNSQLQDQCILVTGAGGSIGAELVRQIIKYQPKSLILLDQAESPLHELELELAQLFDRNSFHTIVADITDKTRMDKIIGHHKPMIIYHAAAYKHVPMMERNPYEAVATNVLGSKIMADLALKHKVSKMVFVSTDKAVNPTNVMGATKRVAEMYIQSRKGETKFITTRFGNVLGSNGSVIPLFRKQIENGGPITVTHQEITRFFMTIPEACSLVLEAGAMGDKNEIFVFDMGNSIKIKHLAEKMISLAGLKVDQDIKIVYTGLRPGEKLYEEVLALKEKTKPTYNEKILIANIDECDGAALENTLENIAQNIKMYSNEDLVSQIKAIVPEYVSNNSEFEKLDR